MNESTHYLFSHLYITQHIQELVPSVKYIKAGQKENGFCKKADFI